LQGDESPLREGAREGGRPGEQGKEKEEGSATGGRTSWVAIGEIAREARPERERDRRFDLTVRDPNERGGKGGGGHGRCEGKKKSPRKKKKRLSAADVDVEEIEGSRR